MNKYERREANEALKAVAVAITRLAIAVENRSSSASLGGWCGPSSSGTGGGGAGGGPPSSGAGGGAGGGAR